MTTWIYNGVSLAIGLISIIIAIQQYRQRVRVEQIVRDDLRRLAGQMRVIWANAQWANLHYRVLGHLFTESDPNLGDVKKRVFDGARDATACSRQLGLVHSHIRGIQKSLFNDSEETLPDIKSDDVKEIIRQAEEGKGASASSV